MATRYSLRRRSHAAGPSMSRRITWHKPLGRRFPNSILYHGTHLGDAAVVGHEDSVVRNRQHYRSAGNVTSRKHASPHSFRVGQAAGVPLHVVFIQPRFELCCSSRSGGSESGASGASGAIRSKCGRARRLSSPPFALVPSCPTFWHDTSAQSVNKWRDTRWSWLSACVSPVPIHRLKVLAAS